MCPLSQICVSRLQGLILDSLFVMILHYISRDIYFLWFQSSSFVRHLESNVIFSLIQTLFLVLFMGNQGENIDLEM